MLTGRMPFKGNYEQAELYISDDPSFKSLFTRFTRKITFLSTPSGTEVYAKPYATPEKYWLYLGKTPLDSIVFPVGFSTVKFEKEGYSPSYDLVWNAYFLNDTILSKLIKHTQFPFFELLGTPAKDKKLFLYDRGHSVPRTQLAKESLNWMDRYLGRVQK